MTPELGEKPRRIRNISELAKLAGVSAGTVSRALAGKDLVNRQTRERIQALAREHGFRPNQMASRLRTGQTGVVGVVLPLSPHRRGHASDPFFDPFFTNMLGCLADELTDRGYDLMLSRIDAADGDEWLDRITDSGMLDGVLLIGAGSQFDTVERVAEAYRPLVVWGSHREGQKHCSVGTDSLAGGRLAGEYLAKRGCRNIAMLGDLDRFEVRQRLEGAREGTAKAGTGTTIETFQVDLSGPNMAAHVANSLDRMGKEVDGIFAVSDFIATLTLRMLHERGRKVPDEIAVMGYDDLPTSAHTVPQLTTVRQDIAGGARVMVESLMQRIAGVDVPGQLLAPSLTIRESA